jgi:hypothetical protein
MSLAAMIVTLFGGNDARHIHAGRKGGRPLALNMPEC